MRYHYDDTVNAYLTSKKANVLFHYIWFQLYNLCIPFYFIFRVAWAYYGLMHHWKMILTHASNSNRLLVPHFGTSTDLLHLWAHWVRVFVSVRLSYNKESQRAPPFLSPFPSNGYKQKPNNCTTIFFTTYARNTLCLPRSSIYPYLSIHPTFTVPNYHRRSIRNYRSDQIEQTLISYGTISTSPPVLVLVLVASTWTTIKFNSYFLRADNNKQSIRFYLSSPTIYYSSIKFYNWFLWHDFSSPMSGILLLIINNSDL